VCKCEKKEERVFVCVERVRERERRKRIEREREEKV
jgi:hypothetical protein